MFAFKKQQLKLLFFVCNSQSLSWLLLNLTNYSQCIQILHSKMCNNIRTGMITPEAMTENWRTLGLEFFAPTSSFTDESTGSQNGLPKVTPLANWEVLN